MFTLIICSVMKHCYNIILNVFFLCIIIGASHWVCTARSCSSKDIAVMDSIGARELTESTL